MRRNGQEGKPRVAVIGAGLAGLSAAYDLREKAEITIFEASDRLGGRILTSHRPRGEHGAEFLLQSEITEKKLSTLLGMLRVNVVACKNSWPGYLFGGNFANGSPVEAAQVLLGDRSARKIEELSKLVRKGVARSELGSFDSWFSKILGRDRKAVKFVDMVLLGETCAPPEHVSTKYGIGSMYGLMAEDERWYCIRGGSEKLVSALHSQSKAHVRLKAQVRSVNAVRGGVEVKWLKNGRHRVDVFNAAVIATPQGERLIRKKPRGHFHSYLNVLLEYCVAPRIKDAPGFDLTRGLYTDGALNYLQLTKRSRSSYVLRILIPDARSKWKWSKQHTVAFCTRHLRQILVDPGRVCASSMKGWEFGLPCGGRKESFKKSTSRIYLAGDRFGGWPSMVAAVKSGYQAAKTIKQLL